MNSSVFLDLLLVPSFVQLAYSVTAVMDALWTPSCRFTSESAVASRLTLRQFGCTASSLSSLCFSSLSPVTDSDKLTEAHEAKKNDDSSLVTLTTQPRLLPRTAAAVVPTFAMT